MLTKFYDIESLTNMFTCTVWVPHQNSIHVYYIDDDNTLQNPEAQHLRHETPLADPKVMARVRKRILECNPKLRHDASTLKVMLLDIKNADGLASFMHEMLMTSLNDEDAMSMNVAGDTILYSAKKFNSTDLLKEALPDLERQMRLANVRPDGVIADTDAEFDESSMPYILGYNSYNYDSTMLAYVAWSLIVRDILNSEVPKERVWQGITQRDIFTQETLDKAAASKRELTASMIRRFNDVLFSDQCRSNMADALSALRDSTRRGNAKGNNQVYLDMDKYLEGEKADIPDIGLVPGRWPERTEATDIRRGTLFTGRHIDVAKLNEKQQKVGLKRLLGMLGYQIFESDKLHGTNTSLSNASEADELIAYNVSDVVYLESLFHERTYASGFDLKRNMLSTYPELVYETDRYDLEKAMRRLPHAEGKGVDATLARDTSTKYLGQKKGDGTSRAIRNNRLYADSSSQQLASRALSPMEPLPDKKYVSLMYPHPDKLADIGMDKPFDVLEDARTFFESEVLSRISDEDKAAEARENFMHVYRAYKRICGMNFDASKKYQSEHTKDKLEAQAISQIAADLPWCLPYYDGDGNQTSYFAVFSTGGVHGAEYNKELFEADLAEAESKLAVLNAAKEYFGDGDEGAIALRNNVKRLKDPLHLCPLDDTPDEDEWPDGQEHFVKEFLTSGSTKNKASWRSVKMPSLWTDTKKSVIEVDDEGRKVLDTTCPDGARPRRLVVDVDNLVWAQCDDGTYEELGTYVANKEYLGQKAIGWKTVDSSKRELKKQYTFTSAAYTNHEDFSSYYPSLLRMMNVFFNTLLGYDRYGEIYLDKERFGKMMKDLSRSEEERLRLALDRNGVKLILNTASGAGDAKFDNNIRMNNNIIAMRMIGQLFTWKIGQAQALHGAGVPSTNTDGLYTIMEEDENNRLLEEVAAEIGVAIEPEPMHLVSKDSNNRLEFRIDPKGAKGDEDAVRAGTWRPEPLDDDSGICVGVSKRTGDRKYGYAWFSDPYVDEDGNFHKSRWVDTKEGLRRHANRTGDEPSCHRRPAAVTVLSASGGTLGCRRGPDVAKSLAHPAVIDWALSEYLMRTYLRHDCEQDAMAQPFDRELGRIVIEEAAADPDITHCLIMFQNILASNPSSYTFIFAQDVTPEQIKEDEDDPSTITFMQHYNRVFVMRPDYDGRETTNLWAARAKVVPAPTMNSRIRREVDPYVAERCAYFVMRKETGIEEAARLKCERDIIRQKVTGIETTWRMLVENGDLHEMSHEDLAEIRDNLDLDAYLSLLEKAYTDNWMNVVPRVRDAAE